MNADDFVLNAGSDYISSLRVVSLLLHVVLSSLSVVVGGNDGLTLRLFWRGDSFLLCPDCVRCAFSFWSRAPEFK